MKTSSKWVIATLVTISAAAYWYHQEQSCYMLTVHTIRHGLTDTNQQGILYGSVDVSLNDTGRQQALEMAEKLAGSSVRELYSSPQKRALETATIIGNTLHIPVIVDDRLRERSFGKAEGIKTKDLDAFMHNNPDHGVEPVEHHVARLTSFFSDMAKNNKREIYVVSHGGTVKSMFDYLDITPETKIPVPNCSLFTFEYNPCSGHVKYIAFQEYLGR